MEGLLIDLARLANEGMMALVIMCVAVFLMGFGTRSFAGHFLEVGLTVVSAFVVLVVSGALSTETGNMGIGLLSAVIGGAAFVLGHVVSPKARGDIHA